MTKRLLILGAGTAGTMMANHLQKKMPKDWRISIVDRSDRHLYQPGLLFLPFGVYRESQIVQPTKNFLPRGVEFIQDEIEKVEGEANRVHLKNGTQLSYDLLVIATGCRTAPEETEGMLGPNGTNRSSTFIPWKELADCAIDWPIGRVVVWSSTSTRCPSSALWHPWSFASWQTLFSNANGCVTRSRLRM